MSDPARDLLTAEALAALDEDLHAEVIDGRLVVEAMTRFEHGDAQLSVGSELKVRFRGGGPGGTDGWWIATEACEVLSKDRRKDVVEERETLHRHGVGHCWLLDLESPLLTVLRHHAEGYLVAQTLSPGERARIEPFDAVELDVARLFGDIDE